MLLLSFKWGKDWGFSSWLLINWYPCKFTTIRVCKQGKMSRYPPDIYQLLHQWLACVRCWPPRLPPAPCSPGRGFSAVWPLSQPAFPYLLRSLWACSAGGDANGWRTWAAYDSWWKPNCNSRRNSSTHFLITCLAQGLHVSATSLNTGTTRLNTLSYCSLFSLH